MNKVTLEKLLKSRVDAVNKADAALEKLDDFCEKNWNVKFHDGDLVGSGDDIVECLNYGHGDVNVDHFITFMDKLAKLQNSETGKESKN